VAAEAVFFVASNCPLCKEVQPKVLELFEDWSIPLVVRKPSLQELRQLRLRGFPSLLLPFLTPPMLLAGSGIAEWLGTNEGLVRDAYRLSYGEHNDSRSGFAGCDRRSSV
jgi:hypothetical protein